MFWGNLQNHKIHKNQFFQHFPKAKECIKSELRFAETNKHQSRYFGVCGLDLNHYLHVSGLTVYMWGGRS